MSNFRILVVDDFDLMRIIIKNLLGQIGYTAIEEAENGVWALNKLGLKKFDFVISDLNMPDMDGIKLTKEIRKDPELKNLPILLTTAETSELKIKRAIQAGINGYIVKPPTGEVLKERIDKILEELATKPAEK